MAVEFIDFSIKVTEAMEEAVVAALEEAAGELESRAIRNSSNREYPHVFASGLWDHIVNRDEKSASVGSPYEEGYWEELGTGEHALNGDGRKGWWVYIEGQESGKGGKSYSTKAEAEEAAAFLRKVKKLDAVVTNGYDPNRPLFRAFQEGKPYVERIFEAKLKGLG